MIIASPKAGKTGTGGGGHGKIAGVCRSDGGADAGYLILALEGLGLKLFMDGQLFQNSRGGRDGIRAAEQRHSGLLGGCEQAPCRGLVAVDVAVYAFFLLCWLHVIGVGYRMYVGCVVEAVLEDFLVGVDKSRFLLELALQMYGRVPC